MNFRTNALAMLTGTAVAQALPLLATPLLTRLFTPEAFGLQTLFMGLAASLAVLATCRLDLALVLPESDDAALPVAAFVFCASLLVSVLTWLAFPLVELASSRVLPVEWQMLLPTMVLAIAMYQLGVGMATRRRAFRTIATTSVGNQGAYVATALVSGFAGGWALGLVVAKIAGQVLGAVLLWRASSSQLLKAIRHCSCGRMLAALKSYRQFLFFNTPYSLIGSVARDAPVYIFSALSAIGAAGFFGLARTVLLAPTLLASNAFSQVFYREAVALKGTSRLQELTLKFLRAGLLTLAPLFAFCAVWADSLFVTLFGEGWRTAGIFAMVMAPAAWMTVQTGWPERLFEVNLRQGVSFGVQIGSDIITAATFAAAYLLSGSMVVAVTTFAVCNVIYHHIYLLAIFRVSGFAMERLAHVLAVGWAVFVSCALIQVGMRWSFSEYGVASWIGAMLFAVVSAVFIGWRALRKGGIADGGN